MKTLSIRQVLISLFVLILLTLFPVYADENFPDATASSYEVSPVFGDNMVLQQNEPIKIWGTSVCEGEIITARLGDSTGYSTVQNGQWEIVLSARACSNVPMVLEIFGGADSDYTTFENITIGDVWWVMGQSNVEFATSATPDWFEFEASLTGSEPVVLYDPDFTSFNQATHTRWRKLSRYSAYNSSALSSFFAKKMADNTSNEVPIAMVSMGYAGREIASFMPPEISGNISYHTEKSNIYNDVISHLMKMPIKGVIWYQGEADAALYADYKSKLSSYITWMRDYKNQQTHNFPVYCVELFPCFPDENDPDRQYIDFGSVRAETCSLARELENFYVCVSSDLWSDKGYSNNLHPTSKSSLANRLSSMVLAKEYGFGNESAYFGPTLKSAELLEDGKVAKLKFDNVGDGIAQAFPNGFLVIGDSWKPITDFQMGVDSEDTVIIIAKEKICIVKYNSETDGVFNESLFLRNSSGIPAAAFSYQFSVPSSESETASGLSSEEPKAPASGPNVILLTLLVVAVLYILAVIIYAIINRNRKQR